MKIDPRYRPELLVSDDDTRWQLGDVRFDADGSLAVATDGHALVAVPVEEPEGPSRYLRSRDLDTLRDQTTAAGDDVFQSRTFPDWRKVVPAWKPGDPDTITIGLDARLLARLHEALAGKDHYNGHVYLTAKLQDGKPTSEPYLVRLPKSHRDDREIALLMPLKAEDP